MSRQPPTRAADLRRTADADGRRPVLLSWSGGKDATLALAELRRRDDVEVVALLTTLGEDHERVSMHGVRRDLLRRQAAALGLPVSEVWIPAACDNATYEARMGTALQRWRAQGVHDVAFGDVFLSDVRRYRERTLAEAGMRAMFPIWGRETRRLARRFVDDGYEATLVCVDTRQLDGRFAGRGYDHDLCEELPSGTDPCGEHGEFHTFVHAGPAFRGPVAVRTGRHVLRDERFMFCDLLPG